jgi:hypothetical protein
MGQDSMTVRAIDGPGRKFGGANRSAGRARDSGLPVTVPYYFEVHRGTTDSY